jgi:arylsulfatase A-like enzyme
MRNIMQKLDRRQFLCLSAATGISTLLTARTIAKNHDRRPNFIFILTDDQRHDALSCAGNPHAHTPNLDRLAARGVRFENAFVTLSICSPSRAACLTGRYGSANGVTFVGRNAVIHKNEKTFAHILKETGYQTGMVGKWHVTNSPQSCGFDYVTHFVSNGSHWNRKVNEQGRNKTAPGFIEDYNASQAINFIEKASRKNAPFVLFLCNQLVHMDHKFDWKPKAETLARYNPADMPVPDTFNDDLAGRPPYLKNSRSRMQALKYGYDKKRNIQNHLAKYYAALEDTDTAIGKVIQAVTARGLDKNTYYIFMGDNGWLMGEHGFTSKVLPYEESIRVPMILSGPRIKKTVDDHLVLNIDLMPTILDLAGLPVSKNVQGHSLMPLLEGKDQNWRNSFLYECPRSSLGVKPHFAVRTARYKYVQTYEDETLTEVIFEELYDLQTDPTELRNLTRNSKYQKIKKKLKTIMKAHKKEIASTS